MRFQLIDQITAFEAGRRLNAVKNLTLGEEYLADHFPTFPVMPGVLMLETLVQAGAWLIRLTDQFTHSVIVAREVKGVKYGTFMDPGHQMKITVEVQGAYDPASPRVTLKGQGDKDGVAVVSARVVLEKYNLKDRRPDGAELDAELQKHYRQLQHQLWRGA